MDGLVLLSNPLGGGGFGACQAGVVWLGFVGGGLSEAGPVFQGHCCEGDEDHLGGDENDEPFEGGIHKSIGVEADTEHVHAEPGKRSDDVSDNGSGH